MNFKRILLLFTFSISSIILSQRTSIGFFYGPSIGYNAVYDDVGNYHNLFDFSLGDSNILNTFSLLDDNNLSNNIELINGNVFGLRFNFPVIKGLSIQPELEFQQLEFNHILYQNSSYAVFNNLELALSGLQSEDLYKTAMYFWKVSYFNFPFVLKIYPTEKFFFQAGFKFGFLLKAEESRILSSFNNNTQDYTNSQLFLDERVVYEFFDSDSGIDNHGFDKDEWPFNWNGSIIGGLGFETKTFYLSLRYNLGLVDFFSEVENKDDDFFEIYNSEIDEYIYTDLIITEPLINNNFKLRSVHLTIGFNISN
tara:strand:+ start:7452 stop:8381 length:930 start_codon:yes stop_codon:yes gene_type:complete